MIEMIVISSLCCFSTLTALICPFWLTSKESLSLYKNLHDKDQIHLRQESLVDRFLETEKSYKKGLLTKKEFDNRKNFLTNRYLDLGRRLDSLEK